MHVCMHAWSSADWWDSGNDGRLRREACLGEVAPESRLRLLLSDFDHFTSKDMHDMRFL